jgi:hypothetical protein
VWGYCFAGAVPAENIRFECTGFLMAGGCRGRAQLNELACLNLVKQKH